VYKASLISILVSQHTHAANRIFYLAVPQEALLDVALPLADSAQTKRGWNRIIIEKPFGFTGLSSGQVTQSLLSRFEEKQIYRYYDFHLLSFQS
jgi:glucose-6-phosphate 1-dehydrogenase